MDSALIVDDNVDACRLMAIMFSQMNIQATAVASADDALSYLKENVPRLVLLDVVMPDMDGIELLETIRKDPRLDSVPVILFSGAGLRPDEIEYARSKGASEFWVKSETLFLNLKQLLAPYLTVKPVPILTLPARGKVAPEPKNSTVTFPN